MNSHIRPFRTLSSRIVWSCPWYRVRQDEIALPNGQTGVYNTVDKTDAVWVLPITSDGFVPMLWQYRYTVDEWCWEIPAGGVEPGQSPEEAARAELLQEVGGTAASLTYIGRYFLANGICSEVGHFFLAEGVVLSEADHEATEAMQVHLKSAAEVLAMARGHAISDGPSALAMFLCAERLEAWTKLRESDECPDQAR